jgi:hypothetical protein
MKRSVHNKTRGRVWDGLMHRTGHSWKLTTGTDRITFFQGLTDEESRFVFALEKISVSIRKKKVDQIRKNNPVGSFFSLDYWGFTFSNGLFISE